MAEYEMRPGADLAQVRALCISSGLEDGPFGDVVLSLGAYHLNQLVGCAVLENKYGKHAVEWLAVDRDYRGKGLGSRIVARIESEARSRGIARLWALARAPDFFRKVGYQVADREEASPAMGACARCPQYLRDCNPEVMFKDL